MVTQLAQVEQDMNTCAHNELLTITPLITNLVSNELFIIGTSSKSHQLICQTIPQRNGLNGVASTSETSLSGTEMGCPLFWMG